MPGIQFQNLKKDKEKTGGKNKSPYDGFYSDTTTGTPYFIKVPSDRQELFTELFIGKLLTKFKKIGIIPEEHHDSLICADLIRCPNGNYGLIQPKIAFSELYKKIHSEAIRGDRSVWYEMAFGPSLYQKVAQDGKIPPGLTFAIMLAVVLGNNSIHSGNVVELHNKNNRHALIDHGAGLRDIAHPDNQDLENPRECQGILNGLLNYKAYTKNYFKNYCLIPGFYEGISSDATQVQEFIKTERIDLAQVINDVLAEIPTDLISNPEKAGLSKSTSLPCEGILSNTDSNQKFAQKLSEFINFRFDKAVKLAPAKTTSIQKRESEQKLRVEQTTEEDRQYVAEFLSKNPERIIDPISQALSNPKMFRTVLLYYFNNKDNLKSQQKKLFEELIDHYYHLVQITESSQAIIEAEDFQEVTDIFESYSKQLIELPEQYRFFVAEQIKKIEFHYETLLLQKETFATALQQLQASDSFDSFTNAHEVLVQLYSKLKPILQKQFVPDYFDCNEKYRELCKQKRELETAFTQLSQKLQTSDSFESFKKAYETLAKAYHESDPLLQQQFKLNFEKYQQMDIGLSDKKRNMENALLQASQKFRAADSFESFKNIYETLANAYSELEPILQKQFEVEFNRYKQQYLLLSQQKSNIADAIQSYSLQRTKPGFHELTIAFETVNNSFHSAATVLQQEFGEQFQKLSQDFTQIQNAYKILLNYSQKKPSHKEIDEFDNNKLLSGVLKEPYPQCITDLKKEVASKYAVYKTQLPKKPWTGTDEYQKLNSRDKLNLLSLDQIREKINLAILGKSKLADAELPTPANGVDSYLGWMNQHAKGTRGITRFTHWYHGDSGKKRAIELWKIANEPHADLDKVITQLEKTFKESSHHHHSLSRYLMKQFRNLNFNQLSQENDKQFLTVKTTIGLI